MGRRYLGYNKRSHVRFTRPTQIVKKQLHRIMFKMCDDEYKLLLEQNIKSQPNEQNYEHVYKEIKRVKYQKDDFDHQPKPNRIIYLDSNLQLNPNSNSANQTVIDFKVDKTAIVRDRIIAELQDYLTLNEKNKNVNIVQSVNNKNKKVLHNNESSNNNLKKAKSDEIEKNKCAVESISLNPMNNKSLVVQVASEKQIYESHKNIQQPFILVPEKVNINNGNSIIVQQQAVKQQMPAISNVSTPIQKVPFKPIKPKPTPYRSKFTPIQQKPVILSQPIFLQPKPIIINTNPLIIKTKFVKVDSIKKQQNFDIVPQHHILVQPHSKGQHKNLLNTVIKGNAKQTFFNVNVSEKKESIFPVALKPSDSNDFEYVKLLNNNSINENEIQILGI